MKKIKKKKTENQKLKMKIKKRLEKEDNSKEIKKIQKRKPINFKKLSKKNRISNEPIGVLSKKKRMKIEMIILAIILTLLGGRIGYIQLIKGEELKNMAYMQQTLDRNINPKRGTIYDSTGRVILAVSSTVETVTVTPTNIKKSDRERIATALSNLYSLDYDTVLKKISRRSSIEIIVKKVDKEKTDQLRMWMQENGITSGINIDEDTKRYYPLNNLASQVLGFCGSDNQGLDGLEAVYDDLLKGSTGKITKIRDASGADIDNTTEEYISAINGNDLILTIDAYVQGIAEKHLKEACIDNVCTDGGNIIIMNPKNGDILALAGYPNYNPNEPFSPNTDELKEKWRNYGRCR